MMFQGTLTHGLSPPKEDIQVNKHLIFLCRISLWKLNYWSFECWISVIFVVCWLKVSFGGVCSVSRRVYSWLECVSKFEASLVPNLNAQFCIFSGTHDWCNVHHCSFTLNYCSNGFHIFQQPGREKACVLISDITRCGYDYVNHVTLCRWTILTGNSLIYYGFCIVRVFHNLHGNRNNHENYVPVVMHRSLCCIGISL